MVLQSHLAIITGVLMRAQEHEQEIYAGVDSHFDSMGWELANVSEIFTRQFGEIGLFRKVIHLALLDLCAPHPKKHFRRYAAERFLLESEAYFQRVCDLADVNAELVRDLARRAFESEAIMRELRARLLKS